MKEAKYLVTKGRSEKKNSSSGKKWMIKFKTKELEVFPLSKRGIVEERLAKNKIQKWRKKSCRDATITSTAQNFDGFDNSSVLITINDKYDGNRVLDSRCSFHIWPDKSLFLNYQTYDSGVVIIRNNACCKVVVKGSIRLKMSAGVISELNSVKHVSDLKKSLISLGMLDKMSVWLSLNIGPWRCRKRSMVIMKKSNKKWLICFWRDSYYKRSQCVKLGLRQGNVMASNVKPYERQRLKGTKQTEGLKCR